jgi:hypothetical protein
MPLLFSYGTFATGGRSALDVGRALQGWPDVLVVFDLATVTIQAPAFVVTSGRSEHAIVRAA